MCGITGIVSAEPRRRDRAVLEMLSQMAHRGPDGGYVWEGDHVVMGIRRLAIVNVERGIQPVFSRDGGIVAVLNGMIYNHVELKRELEALGYAIRDGSDAEVIPHAYEQWGIDFVSHFNGQFAIALWDARRSNLLLARDRVGLKPLYYAAASNGDFLFGSEIKALFAHPNVRRRLDPQSIAQVFTFWTLVDSYSAFEGVRQVPCASVLRFGIDGTIQERHEYWTVPRAEPRTDDGPSFDACLEQLRETLREAVRLRLRADVPIGTYTSGGVDSSIINSLAYSDLRHHETQTFSVSFEDALYDESTHQRRLVEHLGLTENGVVCRHADIYEHFPQVVFHAEAPIFRTAPVPMYMLSRRVRERGLKVVLTGEGADEVMWGYDIYRETMIRRFWAREPDSKSRPQLLRKLYAYLPQFQNPRYFNMVIEFFKQGLTDLDDPLYSHRLRISNSVATHSYFNADLRQQIETRPPLETLKASLPADFAGRSPLEKCQFLEMKTLLAGYLLSSQGDRMQSAHGVEGRCPYLEYHVIEFMATLPESFRVNGLRDKFALRRAFADRLPASLIDRPKFAYRAPEMEAFVADDAGYVGELLGVEAVREAELFDAEACEGLLRRMKTRRPDQFTTRDNMAFVQVLSTQLLYRAFIRDFDKRKRSIGADIQEVRFDASGVTLRGISRG